MNEFGDCWSNFNLISFFALTHQRRAETTSARKLNFAFIMCARDNKRFREIQFLRGLKRG